MITSGKVLATGSVLLHAAYTEEVTWASKGSFSEQSDSIETLKRPISKPHIRCKQRLKANGMSDSNEPPTVLGGEYTCLSTERFPSN